MDEDKLHNLIRIREELEDLQKIIDQDNENGYLLRSYTRQVIEDKILYLITQEKDLLKD